MSGFLVYKIQCYTTGLVFYGATTEGMATTMSRHIYNSKNNLNCASRLVLKGQHYQYEILENDFTNKRDMKYSLRYYIESNQCVNIKCPIRSSEESDKLLKEWQSLDNLCECGAFFTNSNRSAHLKMKSHKKNILHIRSML